MRNMLSVGTKVSVFLPEKEGSTNMIIFEGSIFDGEYNWETTKWDWDVLITECKSHPKFIGETIRFNENLVNRI